MDIDAHEITDDKVIVCLDSLHRIKTSNFDFIFIDEATSVFLHFQSTHIQNSQVICLTLELLLTLPSRYICLMHV
jgi:hypothetical protein